MVKGLENQVFFGPGKPEPEVEAPEARGEPAAVGEATATGGVVPGAATHHAILSTGRALRIALRAVVVVLLPVPVLEPFPHVAAHVVLAQFALGLLAYRVDPATTVAGILRHTANVVVPGVLRPTVLLATSRRTQLT